MGSKENILSLLEENKTNYISGEAIANKLGISRNAVWKAINELRKQGYIIEAVSNKGYLLGTDNDIISKEGILSYIDTKDFGELGDTIFIHDSLDSTNKTAKELVISGVNHGTLIIARKQELGKGRKDHNFYSPDGGIYMSIVLSPDKLPCLEPDVITAYTGVSVCRSIEKLCNILPSIKPINDLFIDGRKICGILTESGVEFDSGLVQWIVVGIGINFDSDIPSFPEELKPIVGSLFAPGQATITKNQLVAEIYGRLLDWSKVDKASIIGEYNKLLL